MPAQQALEHELMGGRPAQPDVGIAIVDDLVVGAVMDGSEAHVAERGERIGGDGDFVVLADDNERSH